MIARERPSRLVLLGHPVAHSLSPVFQNAALAHCGIPMRYETLDVAPDVLGATLDALARDRVGGNVTIPHKQAVAARAHCTALAERVGAVNTFWHDDGALIGHNTDVAGVVASIRALGFDGIDRVSCTVLGAGGSAAAVLVALDSMGCTAITVAARSVDRARRMVDRLAVSARVTANVDDAVQSTALVVNTTPVGMMDDAMPVALASLPPTAAVFDLVYRGGETAWVRGARALGLRATDGLGMLLEQGAAAFECWFGITAPREVMRRALSHHADGEPA